MTSKPANIASCPIAILGAGTRGRRIALMLATYAEMRLFSHEPIAAATEAEDALLTLIIRVICFCTNPGAAITTGVRKLWGFSVCKQQPVCCSRLWSRVLCSQVR